MCPEENNWFCLLQRETGSELPGRRGGTLDNDEDVETVKTDCFRYYVSRWDGDLPK